MNKISEYLNNGVTFNQETTLCGKSIINNIRKAKKLGYQIEMHYIGLDSVYIAKERVKQRVEHQNGLKMLIYDSIVFRTS